MDYSKRRSLVLSDQALFEEYLRRYPPVISEYTFTNIYSWKDHYNFEFEQVDSYLVLYCKLHDKQVAYVPIGAQEQVAALMLKLAREGTLAFVRVPEDIVNNLKGFKPVYDPDNSDYLYNARDLIELSGRKYDGKRNLIKKFKSNNNYIYQPLDQACIKECLAFEERWCQEVDCEETASLVAERLALHVMLEHYELFGLVGGVLRVNNNIVSLAIGQKLSPDTLVMHILKASRLIPGLYQTMYQEFLQREAKEYLYVNMEQDLGIEGLRKAKLSYQPTAMVKKYTLSLE